MWRHTVSVPRIPRRTLIPALGLALVVAGAVGVTLTAGQAPEAKLRACVRAYLSALQDGDPVAAAGYRIDRDPQAAQRRAATREGAAWVIRGQQILPNGGEAVVYVTWARTEGRSSPHEVQMWQREKQGTWSFVALDG